MHPNPNFRHQDRDFHRALIEQVGFGMVFADTPDGPRVAHTPILLTDDDKVCFHLARGNALTRHLPTCKVLIVVNGADAYISARWYSDPDQVSTWNYIAVELEGSVRAVEQDELVAILRSITAREEARIRHGAVWTMDKLSDKNRKGLLRAIVGFEMSVESWRETVKLAQHKSAGVREELITGLEREGANPIAQLMREVGS